MPVIGKHQQMENGISVVICCYNSARTIGKTLVHLAGQQTRQLPAWEVIIVNNNCTDDTVSIVHKIWDECHSPAPLTVIEEPEPGLIFARKAGADKCRYSYTVFCDDDNFLEAAYLETAYLIMTGNRQIGVLGGQSKGYFNTPPPSWFNQVAYTYAIGRQADASGDVTDSRGHVWGAGMTLPTHLARQILNAPLTTTGRKGKSLASGDDTEICYKAIEKGYRIYYDERLQFEHYITDNRLTWPYTVKLTQGHVQTLVKLSGLKKQIFEKTTESRTKLYKDFLYLLTHNIKARHLLKIFRILNFKNREGDLALIDDYIAVYFVWCFWRFKILGKN